MPKRIVSTAYSAWLANFGPRQAAVGLSEPELIEEITIQGHSVVWLELVGLARILVCDCALRTPHLRFDEVDCPFKQAVCQNRLQAVAQDVWDAGMVLDLPGWDWLTFPQRRIYSVLARVAQGEFVGEICGGYVTLAQLRLLAGYNVLLHQGEEIELLKSSGLLHVTYVGQGFQTHSADLYRCSPGAAFAG